MDSPPFILSLLLLFSLLPAGTPDLNSDAAALLALRAAVGRSVLSWNSTTTPCSWQGVICESNRVVVLRLPGVGLIGQITAGSVGNLTQLRTLSLRLNALSGSIPPDLSACTQLRYLYLQGNLFSGEIPPSILSIQNLVRLNLAANNFSGAISPTFNNLTRLGTLYLESNQLSGKIPYLDLPNLVQFNVSFNRLNGSIPSKLRKMPSNAFLGMSLCGGPLLACPGEIAASQAEGPDAVGKSGGGGRSGRKRSKLSGGAIAGIAIGSAIGVLIMLILLILLCRRRSGRSKTTSVVATAKPAEVEVGGNGKGARAFAGKVEAGGNEKKLVFFGGGARPFDLEDLLSASAEVLGKGMFGTAYKVVLEMGTVVAVKRLKDVNLPEKEFREKIEAVGAMDHPNLVPLRAYYYSKDEKLLVYDYMTMGSLSALLHGKSPLLHYFFHLEHYWDVGC